MAISGKYGKLDIPRIGVDEPIFILRAQDKLAAAALEIYQTLLQTHKSPLAETIQDEINLFNAWRGFKKIPD
ncbi:MAG TPA: hypothetical protein VK564_00270 [Thermodesulfobacteriota bacterium]|nr:hypothetical protein [Thermodesulfobacteriota bacterium]